MASDGVFDAALAVFHGESRERDVALYRVALDVCKSVGAHYGPPEPPQPISGLSGMSLEVLRGKLRDDSSFARIFGQNRASILEHEEKCARRLDVLRSTAATLVRLAQKAEDPSRLHAMLDELGTFVAHRWRIDINLDTSDRDWSLRVSRRYDLLPPSWRSL